MWRMGCHPARGARTRRGRLTHCSPPFAVRGGGYGAPVPRAIAELRDVELAKVEAAVGSSSFRRGRGYARKCEQQVRGRAFEWQVADLVYDQAVVALQAAQAAQR